MRSVIIAKGGGLTLTSWGNGIAYGLSRDDGPPDNGLFWQAEEATAFRDEWEALEEARPHDPTGDLLNEMESRYA